MKNSTLTEKLLEEVRRYNEINGYTKKLFMEQTAPPDIEDEKKPPAAPTTPGAGGEVTPPPPGAEPTAGAGSEPMGGEMPAGGGLDIGGDIGGGGAMPPAGGALDSRTPPPPPGEEAAKPDATAGATPEADDTTEEIDITDLVNMTKNIKQHLDTSKSEASSVIEKMDSVFSKLDELEGKLGEMDKVIAKIDEIGGKIDQIKPPTPVEKLEMRSLDSYPFNKTPSQFFNEKQGEMRASGKNEYVLTKDDVENYGRQEIMKSFNPLEDEEDEQEFRDIKY